MKIQNNSLELRKALQMKVQKETQQKQEQRGTKREFKSGASITSGGVTYYLPDNFPSERGVQLARLYQLNEGESTEAILFDTWVDTPGHKVNSFSDISMFPEWVQRSPKNIQYKKFSCSFKAPDLEGETSVSPDWVTETSEDGESYRVLGDTDVFVVVMVNSNNKFELSFPESPNIPFRVKDFGEFETDEEAFLAGQAVFKSLTSCGFCEEQLRFYSLDRIERLDKKSKSWKLPQESAICMYVLSWNLLSKTDKEKHGRVKYKSDNGMALPFDFYPDKGNHAVRKGLFFLDTPVTTSAKSSKYRTMENFQNYRAQVSCKCATCMDKIEVNSARELNSDILPRLVPKDIIDPVTGDSLLGTVLPREEAFESNEAMLKASEELFIHEELTEALKYSSEEEVRQMIPESAKNNVIFDEGTAYVLPVLKLACSNPACTNPRRTLLSEITTVVTHEKGGFYSFRMGVPEDRKMLRSWDLLPADTFGEMSIADSLKEFASVLTTSDAAGVFKYPKNFDVESLTLEEIKKFLG